MYATPVVVIAFNRPTLTRRLLDRLREAAPTQLFLIADGPRSSHPDDADKCAAVRAILEEIDWPCQVRRRYSDDNRGCEATVETGLDWVFSEVEEAVILEDDCLPGADFLDYCEELLKRHRDDERVAHISGTSLFVPSRLFGADSYAFGSFAGVWGWATWRRAWQRHRALFPRTHDRSVEGVRDSTPRRTSAPRIDQSSLVTRSGRGYFRAVAHSTEPEGYGWDSHWYLTTASTGSLAITPSVNLVENIGFDAEATHTRSTRQMPVAQVLSWPIRHPEQVRLNEVVERELELVLVRANGRLARRLRSVVPPGPLRTAARMVSTGPATSRVMHGASRSAAALRAARRQRVLGREPSQ